MRLNRTKILQMTAVFLFVLFSSASIMAADAPKDVPKQDGKAATPSTSATPATPVIQGASKDKKDAPAKPVKVDKKEQERLVQVQLRKLADKFADTMKSMPDGKYGMIAVMKFGESGKMVKDKELGALVSVELMTYLHKDHGFDLVERDKLDKIMKELSLQQSGLIDDSTAAKIGKMASAQSLVLGMVSEVGSDFVVNARLVSVETAKVLVTENISIPIAGMVAFSSDAIVLRTKTGALFRSLVVPGWGQIYNKQEIKGGIYLGLTVAFFATAIVFELEGNSLVSQYKKSTDPEQIASLKKNAEDKYLIRNIGIYCGIAMWAINVVDAYVFGMDVNKAISSTPILKDTKLALNGEGAYLSWVKDF